MAEEIRGEDGVALAQPGKHLVPRRGAPGDPVEQDQQRAAPGHAIADPVAVQDDLGLLHATLSACTLRPRGRERQCIRPSQP